MADAELIKRCREGDRESLDELYRVYRRKALGTAYLISDHKGIAEDIVQETFIRCFADLEKLKTPETFDVWFYRILVRTGWKLVGKYNSFLPVDDEEMEDLCSGTNPDPGMERTDTLVSLGEAIDTLSLPLKTTIILYYFNDMNIRDIAAVMNCFQGTVKSRLHNAKKQLYCELYGTFFESADHEKDTAMQKRKVLKLNGESN